MAIKNSKNSVTDSPAKKAAKTKPRRPMRAIEVRRIRAETLHKITGKPTSYFTKEVREEIQKLMDVTAGRLRPTYSEQVYEARPDEFIYLYDYIALIQEHGETVQAINKVSDFEIRPKGRLIIKRYMNELLRRRDLSEVKPEVLSRIVKDIIQTLDILEAKESFSIEFEIENTEGVESKRKEAVRIVTEDPALKELMEGFIEQNRGEG